MVRQALSGRQHPGTVAGGKDRNAGSHAPDGHRAGGRRGFAAESSACSGWCGPRFCSAASRRSSPTSTAA